MRIALGQVETELGNKERNLDKIERVVSENECDLAVFGELFLTGYMCRGDFPRLANTAPTLCLGCQRWTRRPEESTTRPS
jgi:predicted amidohydrolase